jgi:hypothetical protein
MITQFADDADAFDAPSVRLGDTAVGANGDLIGWQRAAIYPATISVIAGSQDMIALDLLANNNRVSKNKTSAMDTITLTAIYPDGTLKTWKSGRIIEAMFGKSVSSAGRIKTKTYTFNFESVV